MERVSHLVLMHLLPALVEGDLPSFGEALTAIQRLTGAWFAPQQGGVFAPGPGAALIRQLGSWGAAGVGQSSWGPAVYGVVGSEAAGRELARRMEDVVGGEGSVELVAFSNRGVNSVLIVGPVAGE